MVEANDDHWLDVLAGKATATDAATRQAASLRRYFERQTADELALPADPEGEKRMLNMLRARGAFDVIPTSKKASAAPGLLARAMAWIFPGDGAHFGRYAAVAALALAVIAGPLLLHGVGGDGEDSSVIKGLPPISASGSTTPGEGLVMSAKPKDEASQLAALLGQAGVVATVSHQGDDFVVQARIGADQIAGVNSKLASVGQAVPGAGVWVVRFQKLP